MAGATGFIIGKDRIYNTDITANGETLEVDFVQGMWGMRSEWLVPLLSGATQEHDESLPSIHVHISSFLWSHHGIRTVVPAQTNTQV